MSNSAGAKVRTRLLGVLAFLVMASSHAFAQNWPAATDTLATALLDSLQVARIELKLSEDSAEAGRQLWAKFANQDLGDRYSQIAIPAEVRSWGVFRGRLVEVVRAQGMPVESLELCLDRIQAECASLIEKGQLFPYGAFLARQWGDDAWLIPCRWESSVTYGPGHIPNPVRAGHVRIWAFMVGSGEKVGYTTCR